jgi:nucleoside-diphosphate-sugar epimerase
VVKGIGGYFNVILVTGATGFVGRSVIEQLLNDHYGVRACSRLKNVSNSTSVEVYEIGDMSESIDWHQALLDIDVVIHIAARVHVMDDSVADPLTEFRKVNTVGTLNLARQAADAGVKRFIFISSIKVNGEMTQVEQPFEPNDNSIPTDPYGLSKYEAEQGLLALAKETGMEVVIIRPPLIYGPNVKANFSSMMKWVNKGVPLPFGAIYNQRSLVALDNLVDFVALCADREKSPKAANQVFLISDGEDVSTTTLLQKVAKAFGKKPMLIPVPVGLMTIAAKLIGKGDVANRLFGSLQVDSSKARELLGWKPVTTMDEQLKKTADAYLEHEKTL